MDHVGMVGKENVGVATVAGMHAHGSETFPR